MSPEVLDLLNRVNLKCGNDLSGESCERMSKDVMFMLRHLDTARECCQGEAIALKDLLWETLNLVETVKGNHE